MTTFRPQPHALPRRFYRINEVAEILGLGKSKVYELVQSGAIKTVYVGRARRIPTSEIDRFVERLEQEGWHE